MARHGRQRIGQPKGPIVAWSFIAIVVGAAASWWPAAGVSRRPVREALAYT